MEMSSRAFSTFLAASFSFMERNSSTTVQAFSRAAFLPSCAWIVKHLSYQFRLGTRRYREDIAVEVNRTPLVFGLRKHFSHSFQHTKALVTNHQFDPIQTTATQPLEEADPSGLVLLHALGGTQNFMVSVFIHCNYY